MSSLKIKFFPQFDSVPAGMNFSEKIVIVIDTVIEQFSTQFKIESNFKGPNVSYNSLYILKRAIEIFIHNKLMLDENHEFAFVTLEKHCVTWLNKFTRDPKVLINTLESIEHAAGHRENFFQMQQIFELLNNRVYCEGILKNNIVRVILFYCRSNVIPRFNMTENIVQDLIQNNNFFLDVLYVHESSCSDYKCKEIFLELTKLDIRNVSYILEVPKIAVAIHDNVAKLLAHPLQRVPQKDMNYSIHPSLEAEANRAD